jgi:hypothetical protein
VSGEASRGGVHGGSVEHERAVNCHAEIAAGRQPLVRALGVRRGNSELQGRAVPSVVVVEHYGWARAALD